MGILYVVGTPIGNLEDITYRAVRILKEVDFICAEDTRVSIKLLNHLNIKKQLISYHDHSTRKITDSIIERIVCGENCAVITDAGMPCISDPGEELVKLAHKNNITIQVIPGASAVISALAISGQDTALFSFEGFLSTSKKQRIDHLLNASTKPNTLIFYEAPHKLLRTLQDLLEFLGDRSISVCHELTKIHESVLLTTISEAINYYEKNTIKGEFVLVVEGKKEEKQPQITLDEAKLLVEELIQDGAKRTEACKIIAEKTGFHKAELYK
ncbi:ribosomal RNA small subunit methyltransferase I [Clostridia bacterium]|nr:ribosomal RNA small subunit methyltransferase I [Clostridia bacterium]